MHTAPLHWNNLQNINANRISSNDFFKFAECKLLIFIISAFTVQCMSFHFWVYVEYDTQNQLYSDLHILNYMFSLLYKYFTIDAEIV